MKNVVSQVFVKNNLRHQVDDTIYCLYLPRAISEVIFSAI